MWAPLWVRAHDHLAHVAEPGVVARPPRPIAGRPNALRRPVGQHLEGRMAGKDGHPRKTVAGEADQASVLDEPHRGQHLTGCGHGGQPLKSGGQQRRRLLAREWKVRADPLERMARLALGVRPRRASRLHPLGDHVHHGLQEGERVRRLHHVGLGEAALLVHEHDPLDLLDQLRVRALLAQPGAHDLRAPLLVPAVVLRVVPGNGRVPVPLGVGALGVVGDRGDAYRLAGLRVDLDRPVQGSLHMAKVRVQLCHPGRGPLKQLAHAVTGRACST